MEMKEECIICKAPLIYLEKDEMMECVLCHKKELSKTRCEQGHYVCNECHTKGMDVIIDICLSETSKNPIEIIRRMMAQPFCHMHGPEHHVMVGSALLAAYKNAGGEIDLPEALLEMMNRGKTVPGGVCGFWGACGAGRVVAYNSSKKFFVFDTNNGGSGSTDYLYGVTNGACYSSNLSGSLHGFQVDENGAYTFEDGSAAHEHPQIRLTYDESTGDFHQ